MSKFEMDIRGVLPQSITKLDDEHYRSKIQQLIGMVNKEIEEAQRSGRNSVDVEKLRQEGYQRGKSHMQFHINNRTGLYG